MQKPLGNEYSPYYAQYISLVPDSEIIKTMESQLEELTGFFKSIPASKAGYRYAEGKWSIKEVLGHISDTERIFAYRALRISRNDKTPLPGFDENEYVKNSNFDELEMKDLLEHFVLIRKSTIVLYKGMNEEMTTRTGLSNGKDISVRAIAYITAGHAAHHVNILKERYLKI